MTYAWYNEIEPFAADWLDNLIAAGHLPQGIVDRWSIKDVPASRLHTFEQCHFFAGIGGWPLALEMAGWRGPVWTGSCPCQPFSTAGARKGFADERHLWPAWFDLIRECRPPVVFGEQVASTAGLAWFDLVSTDLEGAGYAVGAADLGAACIGAPHIRQRLWWVAVAHDERRKGLGLHLRQRRSQSAVFEALGSRTTRIVGDASGSGSRGVAHESEPASASVDPWSTAAWLPCSDGKARPIEPGIQPLVDGLPGRMGRLRAYGNAIVPSIAVMFIESVMDLL